MMQSNVEEPDEFDELGLTDNVIKYAANVDEYGLPVRDGGSSYILIAFCPWCGRKLPASRRDAWIEQLDRLGLEPFVDDLPDEFTDDRWWRGDPSSSGN